MTNKVGRPAMGRPEKEIILQKLEPYLKGGFSLRSACSSLGIQRSTIYYLMDKDEWFLSEIERYKQYISVIVTMAMASLLYDIVQRQNKEEKLLREDIKFLEWFAVHSHATAEEFGRRQKTVLFDPEEEIRRIEEIIGTQAKLYKETNQPEN